MEPTDAIDAFVLVSKKRQYTTNERPVVRVNRDTYDTLAQLAARSGLSMCEIVGQAVRYAVDHLVWAEEE